MERYMNKKYKLVESENYDAFLRRIQLKFFYRKLELIVKQVIKLSEKDGKYQFETFWPMKSTSVLFRPGVPFEETRVDGVGIRSLVEFKDNKMIHTQTFQDITAVFVREFTDKQVTVTISCGEVSCKRLYARVYEK